jgi:RNA-directed DNA polymerase
MIAVQKSAEGIVVGASRRRPERWKELKDRSLMRSKRQKIQLELAFGASAAGEARTVVAEGTEGGVAATAPASSAASMGLMEAIVASDNLRKALAQVQRNKGAAGVDGMTVADLTPYLIDRWPTIRAQLLDGTYRPQPVRRVEIPKATGGTRPLGIPTVLDRLIQQAVLQVLQAAWDGSFSPSSYGFRPGRSAHQAVARAQEYLAAGRRWVVDLDLEKFFDRVNHDLLMGLVAKRVDDKRVLQLIRGYLTAGVLIGGLVGPTDEGTPQGGPLSPLLSNLMLDVLDKELERRDHRFVRYADDCNIYVQSRRAGERVMATVTRFLTVRLKLTVNAAKSAVARPTERKFLGFSFTAEAEPRRRIAPQALVRFTARVRSLTRRTAGTSLEQAIASLSRYLTGWRGYFGFCQTPEVLRNLDGWVRRRLRALAWAQWRTGKQRYRTLRRYGLDARHAAQTAAAAHAHGPWRLSRHPVVQAALSNRVLANLGLPLLSAAA